jgi:anti-anti-sigma regulatory factor
MLESCGFQLRIDPDADRSTMYIRGEVDVASRPDMVKLAGILLERHVLGIRIDLGHVSFIDTAGYRFIGCAVAALEAAGLTVQVTNPSFAVESLQFKLRQTTDHAVSAFAVRDPRVPDHDRPRRRRPRGRNPRSYSVNASELTRS